MPLYTGGGGSNPLPPKYGGPPTQPPTQPPTVSTTPQPPTLPTLPSIDYGSLANDPIYARTLAILQQAGAVDKASLAKQEGIANQQNALTMAQLRDAEVNAQRGFTNQLAARQAIESGDNAFGHNQIAKTYAQREQAAQLQLADYLAGVEAAYAQRVMDRQMQQVSALDAARNWQYGLLMNQYNAALQAISMGSSGS